MVQWALRTHLFKLSDLLLREEREDIADGLGFVFLGRWGRTVLFLLLLLFLFLLFLLLIRTCEGVKVVSA